MTQNKPDSHQNILTAIDIGNTRTHIALVTIPELKCIVRDDFLSKDLENQLLPTFKNLKAKISADTYGTVTIASVIESLFHESSRILMPHTKSVVKFCYSENLPIKIQYSNPTKLGHDRIADALYCHRKYQEENVIIIGAGTAITVNLLQNDIYLGGAILPGIEMQLRSLNTSTDALPYVNKQGPASLPGTSTEECIRAGVMHGTAGALQNIISKYAALIGNNYRVVTTGGAWNAISSFINFEFTYQPDMTLIGVALFNE